MTRQEMPFQWFVVQTGGPQGETEVTGKASTRELADKARRSWIARLETSNKKWGGKFAVLSSGVRG